MNFTLIYVEINYIRSHFNRQFNISRKANINQYSRFYNILYKVKVIRDVKCNALIKKKKNFFKYIFNRGVKKVASRVAEITKSDPVCLRPHC